MMETKYFNPETLENLMGDDKDTMIMLLEKIINGALEKYDSLNVNFSHQDWPSLKDSAHFLKSNFRHLGCMQMATILKNIEFNSQDNDRRIEITSLVKEFNQNFPIVIKEVESYMNHLKN